MAKRPVNADRVESAPPKPGITGVVARRVREAG